MNTALRDYPAADLRVSDADRDRALLELSNAFQAGRITADELNERSEQALGARTGKELTALLADLPVDRPHADVPVRHAHRQLATRVVVGACGTAAASLTAVAVTNALSRSTPGRDLYGRELAREVLARMGLRVGLPPAPAPPGFDWVGVITPAAFAVVLVAIIVVVLHVARSSRAERRAQAR